MIQFHAGQGPDSQAIGIALEEMFLDYKLAAGRAPVPVTVVGQARLPGANNVLMALARMTNRFLAGATDAAVWLTKTPPSYDELEAHLGDRDFIAGAYSILDMAMYPVVARAGVRDALPNTAQWAARLRIRPAVGRGMMVVAA